MVRITSQSKAEQLTEGTMPQEYLTLVYNINFYNMKNKNTPTIY